MALVSQPWSFRAVHCWVWKQRGCNLIVGPGGAILPRNLATSIPQPYQQLRREGLQIRTAACPNQPVNFEQNDSFSDLLQVSH